jgi:hypothetical protein
MAYVGAGQNKYTVFPVENYTFGHKSPKVEKQRSLEARFKHLKEKYDPYIHTRESILLSLLLFMVEVAVAHARIHVHTLAGMLRKACGDQLKGLCWSTSTTHCTFYLCNLTPHFLNCRAAS